jgi:K+/H+ antiporter YhaU regulatory subunit KhtT
VIEAGTTKDIWNVNPSPTDIMGEGDILVLIGTNKDLGKLTG